MYWLEPSLVQRHGALKDGEILLKQEEEDWGVPALQHFNMVGDAHARSDPIIELRKEFAPGIVHWEQEVKATYSEYMELDRFPYDIQTLKISLRIDSKADKKRDRFSRQLLPENSVRLDKNVRRQSPTRTSSREETGRARRFERGQRR